MDLSETETLHLSAECAREIAEQNYAEVLAYCRRHAPSGTDPADLAQETFLRFVRTGTYRDRGKPIAYLMRIARSVCVDASRVKKLETIPLDFDVADEGTSAPDLALEEALAKLPSDLREVIELRFSAGLGVGDVARVLGISRFAVHRRISSALQALKCELGEGDTSE